MFRACASIETAVPYILHQRLYCSTAASKRKERESDTHTHTKEQRNKTFNHLVFSLTHSPLLSPPPLFPPLPPLPALFSRGLSSSPSAPPCRSGRLVSVRPRPRRRPARLPPWLTARFSAPQHRRGSSGWRRSDPAEVRRPFTALLYTRQEKKKKRERERESALLRYRYLHSLSLAPSIRPLPPLLFAHPPACPPLLPAGFQQGPREGAPPRSGKPPTASRSAYLSSVLRSAGQRAPMQVRWKGTGRTDGCATAGRRRSNRKRTGSESASESERERGVWSEAVVRCCLCGLSSAPSAARFGCASCGPCSLAAEHHAPTAGANKQTKKGRGKTASRTVWCLCDAPLNPAVADAVQAAEDNRLQSAYGKQAPRRAGSARSAR